MDNPNICKPSVRQAVLEGKLRFEVAGHSMQQFLCDVAAIAHWMSNQPAQSSSGWTEFHHRFWKPDLIKFLTALSNDNLPQITNDIVSTKYGQDNHLLIHQLDAINQYQAVVHRVKDFSESLNHINKWKAYQFNVLNYSVY